MIDTHHRRAFFLLLLLFGAAMPCPAQSPVPAAESAARIDRKQVLEAMKRGTAFMVESVSTQGGYVWSYLSDLSRRWGEIEARRTMVWVQAPGTPTMGHLFIDAYHATGLRRRYEETKALSPEEAVKGSPLAPGAGKKGLPKYFVVTERRPGPAGAETGRTEDRIVRILETMDEWGRWKGELGMTSHPYTRDGSRVAAPGDFSRTQVGDETDTSPYRAPGIIGVSTGLYIRNMSELIRFLESR